MQTKSKREHHSVGDLCLCVETRLTGTNCWPRSWHQSLSRALLRILPTLLSNLVFWEGRRGWLALAAALGAPTLPNFQLSCHCLCLGRVADHDGSRVVAITDNNNGGREAVMPVLKPSFGS